MKNNRKSNRSKASPSLEEIEQTYPHIDLEALDREAEALPDQERFRMERAAEKDTRLAEYLYLRYPTKKIADLVKLVRSHNPDSCELGRSYDSKLTSIMRSLRAEAKEAPKPVRLQTKQPRARSKFERMLADYRPGSRKTFSYGDALRNFFVAVNNRQSADRILELAQAAYIDEEAQSNFNLLDPIDRALLKAAIAAARAQ